MSAWSEVERLVDIVEILLVIGMKNVMKSYLDITFRLGWRTKVCQF